jgi:hypothetical protein
MCTHLPMLSHHGSNHLKCQIKCFATSAAVLEQILPLLENDSKLAKNDKPKKSLQSELLLLSSMSTTVGYERMATCNSCHLFTFQLHKSCKSAFEMSNFKTMQSLLLTLEFHVKVQECKTRFGPKFTRFLFNTSIRQELA